MNIKQRLLTSSLAFALISLHPAKSPAQMMQGWSKPVVTMEDAGARSMITSYKGSQLPAINQPQPGWSSVADIVESDGTAPTTSCGTYPIIAVLQAGILEANNQQWQGIAITGGYGQEFAGVSLSPVWVHQSALGNTVCDTTATLLMADGSSAGFTPQTYQFETFAKDGTEYVQFITDGQ